MDAGTHWMDIKIVPTRGIKPNTLTKEIGEAIKSGTLRGGGEVINVFRVVGENRVVAALEGGVHGALEAVNDVAGDCIQVTTEPIRTYQSFSEKDLGVDPDLVKTAVRRPYTDGRILWMFAVLEYRGVSQDQFKDIWRQEAEAICTVMTKGELVFDIYKVIGSRHVHGLFDTNDMAGLDHAFWTLPIHAAMGDQVQRTFKSLDLL